MVIKDKDLLKSAKSLMKILIEDTERVGKINLVKKQAAIENLAIEIYECSEEEKETKLKDMTKEQPSYIKIESKDVTLHDSDSHINLVTKLLEFKRSSDKDSEEFKNTIEGISEVLVDWVEPCLELWSSDELDKEVNWITFFEEKGVTFKNMRKMILFIYKYYLAAIFYRLKNTNDEGKKTPLGASDYPTIPCIKSESDSEDEEERSQTEPGSSEEEEDESEEDSEEFEIENLHRICRELQNKICENTRNVKKIKKPVTPTQIQTKILIPITKLISKKRDKKLGKEDKKKIEKVESFLEIAENCVAPGEKKLDVSEIRGALKEIEKELDDEVDIFDIKFDEMENNLVKDIVHEPLEFSSAPTIKSSNKKPVPLPQVWNSETSSLRDCLKALFAHLQQYGVESNKQKLNAVYFIFETDSDRLRYKKNFLDKLNKKKEINDEQMVHILKKIIESYDSLNCLHPEFFRLKLSDPIEVKQRRNERLQTFMERLHSYQRKGLPETYDSKQEKIALCTLVFKGMADREVARKVAEDSKGFNLIFREGKPLELLKELQIQAYKNEIIQQQETASRNQDNLREIVGMINEK